MLSDYHISFVTLVSSYLVFCIMVPKGKLIILTVKTSSEILYELENIMYNTLIIQHKCYKNVTTLNDKSQFVKKIWNNKITKKKRSC